MTAAPQVGPMYKDGRLTITWLPDANGFRVDGTVDFTSRSGLAAALAAAQQGIDDIHVDMSGLEFIDMEGLRLLMRAARGLANGRSLRLRRAPAYVRQLLYAANWDDTPGLWCDEVRER
ncbi:MAG: STAS domain-containing protein [Micromonosporaceae bacterium]